MLPSAPANDVGRPWIFGIGLHSAKKGGASLTCHLFAVASSTPSCAASWSIGIRPGCHPTKALTVEPFCRTEKQGAVDKTDEHCYQALYRLVGTATIAAVRHSPGTRTWLMGCAPIASTPDQPD